MALGIPIGNRQAIASFTDSEYALTQAGKGLETLELAARVQVRDAVRAVQTTLKRVKAAQVNVRLQKEKLSAEQKKFENGMSTSFQVLQFQNDLFTAQVRENLAMVDYNKAQVELERVQGTLLEARHVAVPANDSRRTLPIARGPESRERPAESASRRGPRRRRHWRGPSRPPGAAEPVRAGGKTPGRQVGRPRPGGSSPMKGLPGGLPVILLDASFRPAADREAGRTSFWWSSTPPGPTASPSTAMRARPRPKSPRWPRKGDLRAGDNTRTLDPAGPFQPVHGAVSLLPRGRLRSSPSG